MQPPAIRAFAGLIALTLLFPALAAAQQTSLAEVARKEAERRKGLKETQKVITAKDLPESARKPAAAPAPAAGVEGATAAPLPRLPLLRLALRRRPPRLPRASRRTRSTGARGWRAPRRAFDETRPSPRHCRRASMRCRSIWTTATIEFSARRSERIARRRWKSSPACDPTSNSRRSRLPMSRKTLGRPGFRPDGFADRALSARSRSDSHRRGQGLPADYAPARAGASGA